MQTSSNEVIESTLRLAQLEGWEKVSVRMIAKEIGYSTIKIYSDFGSKEQLFLAIRKRGFEKIKSAYQQAIQTSDKPEVRLESVALAHINFAIKNPTYYELMFAQKLDSCQSETARAKRDAADLIFHIIEDIGAQDACHAFLQFYATLSGYVQISKEFPEWNERNSEDIIRQFVKNFIRGIQ